MKAKRSRPCPMTGRYPLDDQVRGSVLQGTVRPQPARKGTSRRMKTARSPTRANIWLEPREPVLRSFGWSSESASHLPGTPLRQTFQVSRGTFPLLMIEVHSTSLNASRLSLTACPPDARALDHGWSGPIPPGGALNHLVTFFVVHRLPTFAQQFRLFP